MLAKKEVERNDPCPCGSGKKYKKCCLNKSKRIPFLPFESFKVQFKETIEPPDPKFKSKDGVLFLGGNFLIPQLQIVSLPSEVSRTEIQKLYEIAPKSDPLSGYGLDSCIHKMYAVKYHLENFAREEQFQINQLSKNCNPHSSVQEQIMNPKLTYELESFLFQVKSSLDVLALGPLNKLLGMNLRTFAIDNLIGSLKKAVSEGKIGLQEANKLKSIVEKNKNWIEELNEMRIQITHISNLKNFCCFIIMPDCRRRSMYNLLPINA